MLDGILNRGFGSKCKSLTKTTRMRIGVVRKRAEAKQRFLKEDLAKLLSNELDIKAYGRTEEFIAGQNLLSCYDFIELACEYIVKHLSSMQKQRECQEECREAVASLMFAAARFSDLPELRDLRDLFQERYGSALECFVNQKFVEKLSPKPPVMEKRLQLLKDTALEFSIKWDSRGFERRMVAPSSLVQAHTTEYELSGVAADTCKLLDRNGSDTKFHKYDVLPKEKLGVVHNGHRMHKDRESDDYLPPRQERSDNVQMLLSDKEATTARRSHNGIICHRGQEAPLGKDESLVKKKDNLSKAPKTGTSYCGKQLDNAGIGYTGQDDGNGDSREVSSHGKAKISPSCGGTSEKNEVVPSSYGHVGQQSEVNPRRQVKEGEVDSLKSCHKTLRPPPYVKSKDSAVPPYVKAKNSKSRSSRSELAGSDYDGHFTDPSPDNRVNEAYRTNWMQKEPDIPVHDGQNVLTGLRSHEKEQYYDDNKIPLPKPRSIRRKQHKSSYTNDDVNSTEDGAAVRRTSGNRRRENSQKGLQILFDDQHHRKDEEERMMDKLLLHYSKKPSTYDVAKLRKKPQAHPSVLIAADTGESFHRQSRDGHGVEQEMVPPTTRSISLPHEQSAPQEAKKIFTRANSFQPDSQARHVHPKLPDYDHFVAQFAALKGR